MYLCLKNNKTKYVFFSLFLWLIAAVLISGCKQFKQENRQVNVELNNQFKIKINQTAVIKSENLKIKFLGVSQDSRCPIGTRCIWEGRAIIKFNIVKNKQDLGDFSLTLGAAPKEFAQKRFGAYLLKLASIDPYPKIGLKIKKSDYTANIIIVKM